MLELEHAHHHVPVTALAFYRDDVILAGEGHNLRAYNTTNSTVLASLRLFKQQAIHGIVILDDGSACLAWGGGLIRTFTCTRTDDGGLSLKAGLLRKTADWILDGAASPDQQSMAFVTAHNALVVATLSDLEAATVPITVEPLIPGANCILYCAQVQWLSASQCLIASGTAFGDVIVWSATISRADDRTLVASAQTHYTFSAHEGSVFGVHMYETPSEDVKRMIATCSDDRTIRIWDISDLTVENPNLTQLQRDTGFGSKTQIEEHAPRCLSKAMGHVSRIWHVRFVTKPSSGESDPELMSFGEDASNILWRLRIGDSSTPASHSYVLEQIHTKTAHAGKHIWSVAVADDGRIATGGADGAVAVRSAKNMQQDPLEVSGPLLGTWKGADNLKAYDFLDDDTLLATTDQGKVVVLTLSASSIPTVSEVTSSLPSLRGYSVVTTLPSHGALGGYAWLAGDDGKVYMYSQEHRRLTHVHDTERKVAGLFACSVPQENDQDAIALLVTSVANTSTGHWNTAPILWLAPNLHSSVDLLSIPKRTDQLTNSSNFVITSFTAFRFGDWCIAILGSRAGAVKLFNLSQISKVTYRVYGGSHQQVHGKEAVTSLYWVPSDHTAYRGFLHSTGRDGTHAVHTLEFIDEQWRLELVHRVTLPLGPNIEGLTVRPDDHVWVWGFRSKSFVAYDVTAQREAMVVECGGAHRNFAFRPRACGGTLVWTKASKVYQQHQSQLPYNLINPGGHGREIKAIAISPSPQHIIATGAEDTNIKLWTYNHPTGFTCLQTLRKHNTGIQHLQWALNGHHLFSSGGFEEFFVWRITPHVSGVHVGVVCESKNPRSRRSDLRVMSFEVREMGPMKGEGRAAFLISMAYSDSTVRLWRYESLAPACLDDMWKNVWYFVGAGDYLTACLTGVLTLPSMDESVMTTATDGHLAIWGTDTELRAMEWTNRHKVHQNAILSVVTHALPDGSTLVITGGDDNVIGITRITNPDELATLLLPRAHAAAVTGLAVLRVDGAGFLLASTSIDQRVKLWRVDVDAAQSGIEGVGVKRMGNVFTAVADVSSLASTGLEDGTTGLVIAGVGMDLWRVPTG